MMKEILISKGGEIEIYSIHSDALRLRAVYYGETGKNEYDLYFRNKNLVVFRETTNYYNAPIGENQVNVVAGIYLFGIDYFYKKA